jgi:hypothetical protein
VKNSDVLSRRERRTLRALEAQFTPSIPDLRCPRLPRAGVLHPSVRALTAAVAVQSLTSFVLLLLFVHCGATWSLHGFTAAWASTLITSATLQRRRRREPVSRPPGRHEPA